MYKSITSKIIVSIIVVLLLVSCNEAAIVNQDVSLNKAMNSQGIVKLLKYNNNDGNIEYTVTNMTFIDDSHNSKVTIKYPELSSDQIDFTKVNEIIMETAKESPNREYGEDYKNLTLDLDYEIKFINLDYLSIVFTGLGYVESTVYPNNIFFSMNFDLKNSSQIKLSDLFTINEELVEKYRASFKQQTVSKLSDYLDDYSTEEILQWFSNSDDFESGVFSYFTKDALGISIGVIHVLGDHIETEIKMP